MLTILITVHRSTPALNDQRQDTGFQIIFALSLMTAPLTGFHHSLSSLFLQKSLVVSVTCSKEGKKHASHPLWYTRWSRSRLCKITDPHYDYFRWCWTGARKCGISWVRYLPIHRQQPQFDIRVRFVDEIIKPLGLLYRWSAFPNAIVLSARVCQRQSIHWRDKYD